MPKYLSMDSRIPSLSLTFSLLTCPCRLFLAAAKIFRVHGNTDLELLHFHVLRRLAGIAVHVRVALVFGDVKGRHVLPPAGGDLFADSDRELVVERGVGPQIGRAHV